MSRVHKTLGVLLAVLTISAVPLFCFFGSNQSMWLDEAYSVRIAGNSLPGILSEVRHDNNAPLYYLLLAVWTRALGISEAAVRSLSAVFYILSAAAVYLLAKSIYDTRTAGICSLLYVVSRQAIKHAQNARMYSLLGLLGILSTLLFLKIFLARGEESKNPTRKDSVLYSTVNILGTFTHYWFFFVLLSHVASHLTIFPKAGRRKLWTLVLVSIVPFAVLWGPVLVSQVGSGATSWMGRPGAGALADTLLAFYGGGLPAPVLSLAVYAAFLILILVRFDRSRVGLQRGPELRAFVAQKQSLVFLVVFMTTLLAPLAVSQIKPIYVSARYTVISLFPLILFIGPLVSRFGNRLLVLVFCYALLLATTAGFVNIKMHPPRIDDKSAAEHIVSRANTADVLVFTGLSRVSIDYYLRLFRAEKRFTEMSFPAEIMAHPGWMDVSKMLAKKDDLEREADQVATRAHAALPADTRARLWVFYGSDNEVNTILKDRLERGFRLVEQRDVTGSSFDRILVYQPPQ